MTSRSDPKKAGAAAQYASHLDHLRLLHDSMCRTESVMQKVLAFQTDLASDIVPEEGLEQRVLRRAIHRATIEEIAGMCKSTQAVNSELDKDVRATMEIARIALNNDWSTAKNAKILQRNETGKSLEDRAIKMTEDERRRKEKEEATPAKRRRNSGTASKGFKSRSGQSGGGRDRGYFQLGPQHHSMYVPPFSQMPAQGGSSAFAHMGYPYFGFLQTPQALPPPPPLTPAFATAATRSSRPFQGNCNNCNVYGHKAADCRKK